MASFIPNADIYLFGILNSKVLMAWLKIVGSRFKSDYRFSASLVYNTFPFCQPTEKQKRAIELTAQKILSVRKNYANSTLADLYDIFTMPKDLRSAHKENDAAVLAAFDFNLKMSESEIVSALMNLYQKNFKSQ